MTNCCHLSGTILRRWKRNWFDLWSDGRLVFYDDQQRRDMEDEIHMKVDCINIRNSSACRGGCDLSFLLLLNRRTRESLKSAFLCSTWGFCPTQDWKFWYVVVLHPPLLIPRSHATRRQKQRLPPADRLPGRSDHQHLRRQCRRCFVSPVSQYYFTMCALKWDSSI